VTYSTRTSLKFVAQTRRKGSTVILFTPGAGQTDPPRVDGQVAGEHLPRQLLTVRPDWRTRRQADVCGAAPEIEAGVLTLNCIVLLGAPPYSLFRLHYP